MTSPFRYYTPLDLIIEVQSQGVWDGEMPVPIPSPHSPNFVITTPSYTTTTFPISPNIHLKTPTSAGIKTKPLGMPEIPGPMTGLYHDQEDIAWLEQNWDKANMSMKELPMLPERVKAAEDIGLGWAYLDEETPRYGGVAWKVGKGCGDTWYHKPKGAGHEMESYWAASISLSPPTTNQNPNPNNEY